MNTIDLNLMVDSYIECALWSSIHYEHEECTGISMNKLDNELAEEAYEQMKEDCKCFIEDIEEAGFNLKGWIDSERLGHDFWLTRNRHGAGFWDRGLGDLGDQLTEVCRPYGSCELFVGDDNKIHCY